MTMPAIIKLAIDLRNTLQKLNINPREYTLELWKYDYDELSTYFKKHESLFNDGELADFKLKVNLFDRYNDFYKSKWTNDTVPEPTA